MADVADRLIVERDAELARAQALVARLGDGRPDAVVVEGAAGIGKSTLLTALGNDARDHGVLVLTATGSRLESETPFGVVLQLFAEHLSAMSDLAAAPGDVHALLQGLYWLAVGLTRQAPLLICVDDAQWADEQSLRFLAYLLRRTEGVAAAVALGVRTGEPSGAEAVLREIAMTPGVETVRPPELSVEGTAVKVEQLTEGAASVAFANACHDVTGGNPFLLEELVATCRVDGIPVDDAGAERVAAVVVRHVSQAVLFRLARLSPGAVEIARSVAVLGPAASTSRAAALAGVGLGEAVQEIDALTEAQILAPDPPLRFRHPLVQSSVYGDLPATSRAARHAAAADLLLAGHASDDVVAAHLLLAEPAGDLRWRDVLHRAAQQAMQRGAYVAATTLLRRALAEAPRAPSPDVHRDLGIAEATYDATAAARDLRMAYDLSSDDHSRAGLAGALAEVLLLCDQARQAAELLAHELTRLEAVPHADPLDPDIRLRLVAQWGQAALASGTPRIDVYDRLRAAAATAPPDASAYPVVCAVAALAATNGRERRDWALAAAAGSERLPMSGAASSLMPQLVNALCMDAEVDTASTLSEQMASAARRSGSALAAAIAQYCTGLSRITAGGLADAEADAAGALEFAREGGWELGLTMSGVLLARAMLERGRPDDAARVLDQVPPGSGITALEHQTMRARVLLAQRHADAALRLITEIDELVGAFGIVGHLVWRVHALVAVGRADEALDVAERVLTTVRERGVRLGMAEALTAVAVASDTAEAWRAAVDELCDGPYRLLTARALAGLGGALRRERQPKAAREVLEQALDLAHRCAAAGLEDDIRTELAATGARPRRTAVTGVAALTAAELRACRLAAQNLSNEQVAQALFVSVKTVETQLSSAYRKLGVRGRPELAAALADDDRN